MECLALSSGYIIIFLLQLWLTLTGGTMQHTSSLGTSALPLELSTSEPFLSCCTSHAISVDVVCLLPRPDLIVSGSGGEITAMPIKVRALRIKTLVV